jgi:hypothetical protein
MSAPRREGADGPGFPPPSSFSWGWSIPAEILEPLLHPAGASEGDPEADPVRSADGPDAELPAG